MILYAVGTFYYIALKYLNMKTISVPRGLTPPPCSENSSLNPITFL